MARSSLHIRLAGAIGAVAALVCWLGVATAGAGPIVWDPANSTYGEGGTAFMALPSPPAPAPPPTDHRRAPTGAASGMPPTRSSRSASSTRRT